MQMDVAFFKSPGLENFGKSHCSRGLPVYFIKCSYYPTGPSTNECYHYCLCSLSQTQATMVLNWLFISQSPISFSFLRSTWLYFLKESNKAWNHWVRTFIFHFLAFQVRFWLKNIVCETTIIMAVIAKSYVALIMCQSHNKSFSYSNSFKSQSSPTRWAPLLFPIGRWGNWGMKRISNFLRVSKPKQSCRVWLYTDNYSLPA